MIMLRPLSTILASSALLASVPLMAQSLREPSQDPLALLQQAIKARGAGNHAAALDAYNKAAAALAQDPAKQDGRGLLLQADLQREIARAIFAGRVEDPCPPLNRSKALLDRARAALAGTSDAAIGEAVDGIEQSLKDQRARMSCEQSLLTSAIEKPDAALAGHYYLSGVMETGSELLLKPDSRFDWYISYGAVDQVARGRWGRDGQIVTLVADVPSADRPLVRTDKVLPWDEEAERRLRYAEWSRQADAVAARCPWGAGVASAPSVYLPEERQPPSDAERAKAAATRQNAERARDAAGAALARAVAPGAGEDDRAAADAAMNDWHSSHYEMEQAHRDAGLPAPDISAPALPPECQQPPHDDDAKVPPELWRRGIAVLVGDPAREMRLSRVGVTFVFDDGGVTTRK